MGIDTTVCENETGSLFAGNGFQTYQWSIGTSTSEILLLDTSYFTGSQPVIVTVTNSFGCSNSDTILVTFEVYSQITNMLSNNVSIYPNPASNYINISISERSKNMQISIYNAQGQLVKQLIPDTEIINVSVLHKGIYYLKITNNRDEHYSKLIIE